jgi:protocatechuate 3,4-dioxygenase beta subunit
MTSLVRRRLVVASVLPLLPGIGLACDKPTAPQTPGPFFKPRSPLRSSLIDNKNVKERLVVSGLVLSPDCKPVANALLDFWHADDFGEYDNKGFRYRGHQFTDAQGRYRLETILPAEYPGRARHIHVNVAAPGGKILTTQLYFPLAFGHHDDGLYERSLEMRMKGRTAGAFDFVVAA